MKNRVILMLCLFLLLNAFFAGIPEQTVRAEEGTSSAGNTQEEVSNMTVQEAIQALRGAGLNVEQDIVYRLLEGSESACMPLDVLIALGLGEYHEDTADMAPVSHAVYAFDAEIFDVDRMYTRFLAGIQMIVPDIAISDVKEDLSHMTDEMDFSGPIPTNGKRSFSFRCNDHPYSIELESHGDWFNDDAIAFMRDVMMKESCPGRLCVLDVMAIQGCLIFYGTEEMIANVLNLLGAQEGEPIF